MSETTLLLMFMIKHFICDFPLQACPYMYKNKGTYGHFGGIFHALVHSYGTFMVLTYPGLNIPNNIITGLCMLDLVLHYHIDWAKMKIGIKFNLKPDNSEWFWILLGFDQLLHFLSYYWFIRII